MAAKKLEAPTARLDEIGRIRARLAAIEPERDETERAPLSGAEIAERASAIADRLAMLAGADVLARYLIALQRRGSAHLVGEVVARLANPVEAAGQKAVPAAALLAAMDREGMVAWLTRIAAAEAADYPPALAEAERRQRVQILHEERLGLERDEVAAHWALEETGLAAPWRSGMSPALVLGLTEE
ncbi:MAG TPA: hypothetical protein P5558_19555 [Geminicoccaceae bacterium]|jgi:hypothetical protein|nr:hypothetical protein [Geminicoccaceae bacterium]HRY26573.1 hypothetical protein [Geminicoccaceae bacterium]